MPDSDLMGKVVVITGASSGFGKGAARKFAKGGASLVLAARREDLLETLATECEALGGQAYVVATDVSSSTDVAALAEAALSQFQRIDVWVNNAGVGAIGRFEDVPLEDHVKVIETDLLGTIYGSYFAIRQFREQNAGILINIASVLGKVPSAYYASYAAAKHGVVGFSAVLRQELAQDKVEDIHVCTVLPTSFDTPFFEHSANYTGHKSEPIPPVYDPDKVVDVIVDLSRNPRDEVNVGAAATFATIAHQLAPGITESVMGRQSHKAQIEKSPPAAETSGNVHQPLPVGTDVKRSA